jgi:glycosyltransferase involved in cell wall biosynthesis
MIRLLHVLAADADFQTSRAVEHLTEILGTDFTVHSRTLGPGGDWRNVPAAILNLRGHARDHDVIHAWGFAALSALAFAPTRHVVFTPTRFPTRRQMRWLRAIMDYRDVQVVAPTFTLRRALVESSVPIERCHLLRPGVDFARVKRRRRDPELRAALGLADDHRVLLAVGESTGDAEHRQLAWTGTILNVLDHKTRILLWGRGDMATAAARFAANLAQPELVTCAEQRHGKRIEFEDLLAAADIAVVSATGPVATLPIATVMAAGVPIVATVTPTVAELLEDRHTALMTPPGTPRLLALRIDQLHADPNLQWKLADMARIEAYEYFSLTRFVDQSRALYQQVVAGQPVNLPEQPPGAGLRFHGRG